MEEEASLSHPDAGVSVLGSSAPPRLHQPAAAFPRSGACALKTPGSVLLLRSTVTPEKARATPEKARAALRSLRVARQQIHSGSLALAPNCIVA